MTIEQLVQVETQSAGSRSGLDQQQHRQPALFGAIDWREFVEPMSVVERKLQEDPAGVYASMEFATRDSYRHATEQIARRSALSEPEVAAKAVELAAARAADAGDAAAADPRAAHVGFYLIDEGLPVLQARWASGAPRSIHCAHSAAATRFKSILERLLSLPAP